MLERQISYIKGALIITSRDLKKQAIDQKELIKVLVLANKTVIVKLVQYRFKLKKEDKLRVDLKHPAYYTLLQIICVEDMCNIHRVPKDKHWKYPRKMYWALNKK